MMLKAHCLVYKCMRPCWGEQMGPWGKGLDLPLTTPCLQRLARASHCCCGPCTAATAEYHFTQKTLCSAVRIQRSSEHTSHRLGRSCPQQHPQRLHSLPLMYMHAGMTCHRHEVDRTHEMCACRHNQRPQALQASCVLDYTQQQLWPHHRPRQQRVQ